MHDRSLTSWLDHLHILLPASHITLVGAGSGSSPWVQWLLQCSQLPATTLVEADPAQYQLLEHRLATQLQANQIQVSHNLVAAQIGESSLYIASLAAESGLLPADSLCALWPNLSTVQEHTMAATTLEELLSLQLLDTKNNDQHLWVLIDCLPAASLLRGAGSLLEQVDVVLARVLLPQDEGSTPCEIDGAGLEEIRQTLCGMQQVALQPTRHPAVAYVLFVRDHRTTLQLQAQTANRMQIKLQQAIQAHQTLEEELARQVQSTQLLQAKLDSEIQGKAELQQKLRLTEQTQLGLEKELAQQSQAMKGLQAELVAETQTKTELQEKLGLATQIQQGLEKELAQRSQSLKGLRAELVVETQTKTELQEKLGLAAQTQQGLDKELAQQTRLSQDLRVELAAERQGKTELKQKLNQIAHVRAELESELARQIQSAQLLQAKLDTEVQAKVELQRKLKQTIQTQQNMEAELGQCAGVVKDLQIKFEVELQSKVDLQEKLSRSTQANKILEASLAQKAELEELFKKQTDEINSARKFLGTNIKKEIANATKQIEIFLGLQSYYVTGELPSINIERHTWPVSPDFAFYLVELLEHNDYDLVIEFGSGISTTIIARTLKKMAPRRRKKTPVKFISFDHLEHYYQQTNAYLVQAGLQKRVQLQYTPLQDWEAPDGNIQPFYACQSTLAALSKKYSASNMRILVVIDGPPAATGKLARYPAGPLILEYFSGASIDLLMDDYLREGEKEIAQRWQQDITARNLTYVTIERKLEKGACLIRVKN